MADYKNLHLEELNYNSYLKVPELLDLQKLLSNPPHHDEMFFIVIHQAAELWFKLMLHETDMLRDSFRSNSVSRALKNLKRLTSIMQLMVRQINLLSTLTPVEFAGFRENLRPASGFQSWQFRKMEFAFGLREEFFLQFFAKEPAVMEELDRTRNAPSLYDECVAALARAGFKIPETLLKRDVRQAWTLSEELTNVVKTIYENPGEQYHWVLLFEAMLDFDEQFTLWRATHLMMVSRTIGQKRGTGGSSGYPFLQSRLEYRFFPELWHLRSLVGPNY